MKLNNKLNMIKVMNNNKLELINFNNVAKINLQYKDRIILNFNHTITRQVKAEVTHLNNAQVSAKTPLEGIFAGYYYIDKSKVTNYQEILDLLMSEKFSAVFAELRKHDTLIGYVNINEVSSVKVSDHNLSVIFNLSHSVRSNKGGNSNSTISADSVISSFDDEDAFDEYVDVLLNNYCE